MNTQCRKDNGQNSWPHCFAGRESKRKSQTISIAVTTKLAYTLGRNLSALQVYAFHAWAHTSVDIYSHGLKQ